MKTVNILSIHCAKLNKLEIIETIKSFLASKKAHLITTPNAEFILRAQHDEEFFYILNHADLSVLDGSGPQFASWAIGDPVTRYPGADLTVDLLKLAESRKEKILLINWHGGLSTKEEIYAGVINKYPTLDFSIIDCERDGIDVDLEKIKQLAPSIIFANLGAPYQEKFLYRILKDIPSLRVALGIGGSFDFIIGKIKRAPKILRTLGLEWMWRLVKKPGKPGEKVIFRRYTRIWNAVFVFTFKFIRWQYILPFLYRPNVACWLYKKIDNQSYVLMVERSDQPGHWQIPQGGTDGNAIEEAAKRELSEELGIDQVETIRIFKNIWRYTFAAQKRSEVQKHLGYKGQKQSLYIGEFKGLDEHFKINFWDHTSWKWVPIEKMIEVADPRRRPSYELYLKKFKETIK